ncbi:hypothetical protein [Mycobacterium arosiense]|uniref:Uncharacterized protein n=1 Tax=Mycobacterium arosiense ATCC BAA-1401 = DSM 45069 TaxID=1265311 RepID=A0A1W9Z726_MYCAI|nr:hypothetical protein [Mycobacterium arosiense]ORA07958.1 hypothetical protein BST14_25615 [Mycobacterium arosiense ATCC BAA-1401 = DSM 45069]
MTTLQQRIETLDVHEWAALTKRAALAALAAAEQHRNAPPAEISAIAAMSERELVEHRTRLGPGGKRPSPVMQLAEAEQLQAAAERQARQAEEDTRDAQAAAQMARDEAQQSARAAAAARERVRIVRTPSAHADVQPDEERAAEQQILQQIRGPLEQVCADAATMVAAAREKARAAEAYVQQWLAERADERAAAQQALDELRGELEQAHADHATELAAARGQAEEQVAAARQAAQGRVARARADAEAAIAQARDEIGQAQTEAESRVAAAHDRAKRQVAAARQAAQDKVARARVDAQAGVLVDTRQPGVSLSVPIPTAELRAHTGPIEDALATVRDIGYMLEAGLPEGGQSRQPADLERVRILVHTAKQQAWDLAHELRGLPARYAGAQQVQAAHSYAAAAASAYGALLQRISIAAQQLAGRRDSRDAEVIEVVTAMLNEHPWRPTAQQLRSSNCTAGNMSP